MLPRRARRHRPGADLLLDPRMIVGDLRELAVAQHVDAAVADVRRRRRDVGAGEHAPRRSSPCRADRCESAIAVAMLAVGEAERRLEAVAFEAERGLERERPGAVLVGAGGFLDEGLDGLDGDARRDLAGDVAAHAVGDDEQADVGAGAVAVLVAAAPEAGVRADGPRNELHRAHAGGQPSRVAQPLQPPVRGPSRLRDDTCSRVSDFRARSARARSRCPTVGLASRSSARCLRRLGARDVDVVGALGELRQDRDAIGQHFGEAEGDRQVGLLLPLAVPQLADRERRQQRRVARAARRSSPRLPGISTSSTCSLDEQPVGRDDLQLDVCRERHRLRLFIFSAFSTASSIVPTM